MRGVAILRILLSIGQAVNELELIALAGNPDNLRDQVVYLPVVAQQPNRADCMGHPVFGLRFAKAGDEWSVGEIEFCRFSMQCLNPPS
jgi:hypothetical protein